MENLILNKTNNSDIDKELEIVIENTILKNSKLYKILLHEIRNPISGIQSLTDLIISEILNDNFDSNKILMFNKIILNTSTSLLDLLEDFQSLISSTSLGERKYFSLEIILPQLLTLLRPAAFKKSIRIEYDSINNDLLYGDERVTATILRNLLTNAIKFTHRNGKVKVSTARKNQFLEISIEDNGIGISKKDLSKIFKIESKFTNLGTEGEKGTGLGLILCKELVEMQGGKIWVESSPGHGSKFTFSLNSP